VVRALKKPVEPVVYCDKDLPRLIKEGRILKNRKAMGTMEKVRDPFMLFNTFRFDGKFQSRLDALKAAGCEIDQGTAQTLLGAVAFHWACYNQEGDPHRKDKVCRPCWRIHLQNGCLHRCK
jgi:hypothetical protein